MVLSAFAPLQEFPWDDSIPGRDVRAVAFSGNGLRAAVVTGDGAVSLFRRTGSRWARFGSLTGRRSVAQLSWSRDGSTLCWIGDAQKAIVWRPGKGRPAQFRIPSRTGDLVHLTLSFDGAWFAGSAERQVCWGRVAARKVERTVPAGPSAPCVLFIGVSDLIVGDRSLVRYSLPSGRSRTLAPIPGYVQSLCLDPEGRRLAALRFGNDIEVRSIGTGKLETRIARGKGYPVSLAWSGGGRYLACELCADHKAGDPDRYTRVQAFLASTGVRVATRPLRDSDVGPIVSEPSKATIYILPHDGPLRRWKFRSR